MIHYVFIDKRLIYETCFGGQAIPSEFQFAEEYWTSKCIGELQKFIDGKTSKGDDRRHPFITEANAGKPAHHSYRILRNKHLIRGVGPSRTGKFTSLKVQTSACEGSNSWMHRWLLKLRFFPKTYIPRALYFHRIQTIIPHLPKS